MGLEKKFRELRDSEPSRFNPPASDSELALLKSKLSVLPEEISIMLSVFNGEIQGGFPVFGRAFFMSCQEIAGNVETMEELDPEEDEDYMFDDGDPDICHQIQNVLYDKRWIPFMGYEGIVYFIDYNPTATGKVGQVFSIAVSDGCEFDDFIADSLLSYLEE